MTDGRRTVADHAYAKGSGGLWGLLGRKGRA